MEEDKKTASSHCCPCDGKDVDAGLFQTLVEQAAAIVSTDYPRGQEPDCIKEANVFLGKVFSVATVALGARGFMIPDSWILGGKHGS